MEILKEGRENTFVKECKRCGCIFRFNERDMTRGIKSHRDSYYNLIQQEVAWINCPNCLERINFTEKECSMFFK